VHLRVLRRLHAAGGRQEQRGEEEEGQRERHRILLRRGGGCRRRRRLSTALLPWAGRQARGRVVNYIRREGNNVQLQGGNDFYNFRNSFLN
jgi:hypothetical protein